MSGGGRKKFLWLFVVVLGVVLVAGGLYARLHLAAGSASGGERRTRDRYAVVREGSFTISVELDGNLDAIERHLIRPFPRSGRHGLEIVQAVEDRATVEAGDVLFLFSDEKHQQQEESLLLRLDDERTSRMLAAEDLEMTKAGNLSSIKTAADQVRSAREALARYEEEDAMRKRRELIAAVSAARVKLSEARRAAADARDHLNDAYMQDPARIPELEKKLSDARQRVEQVRVELDKAHGSLRIFKQYDHPQKMRSLQEALTKGQMNLQKNLIEAAGNVVKAERRIQNHQTRIAQLETELSQLREIRANLVLTAPVAGIVSLDNPNRRHWQNPADLKVGSQVREGQVIASIPDLSVFVVNIDLPEELRSRIKIGQQAVLRSRAIPDLVLAGEVSEIAAMARNVINWDASSPKVYPTKIATDAADERLMPGMTMRAEIVVEEVSDALFVPIEAIYNREGRKYCRVRGLTGVEEREVTSGRASNDFVEVLSGLAADEKVLLHQPGILD